jgi:multidrug transporter EmrE-like cation transporter
MKVQARPSTGPGMAALGVMLGAVALQVAGAVVLKVMADADADRSLPVLFAGIGAVLALNLLRLAVWGYAHQRFPLSTTFPHSSLFFPIMLMVAVAFGEQVRLNQVVGALTIAAGSFWLAARSSARVSTPPKPTKTCR